MSKLTGRKLGRMVGTMIFMYVVYVFFSGVIIFKFISPNEGDERNTLEKQEHNGTHRVVLLEHGQESAIARLDLIKNAEETIDVTYYTVNEGVAASVFFASILDAADRGVQVRVLLDGMFHNLRGTLKDMKYAFSQHPNIELKLYEPFQLWKPWTWQNRLHDKLIVVDQQQAIIGGRNMGDKYFASNGNKGVTKDRDVLILNVENSEEGTAHQLDHYFDLMWNHHFSKEPVKTLSERKIKKGDRKAEELHAIYSSIKEESSIDWMAKSIPVDRITLIHNPLERFNKHPTVWKELVTLMIDAESSIFVQSPYIIPTKRMFAYFPDTKADMEVMILTNSMAASPNIPAFSGYYNKRKSIIQNGVELYEYQGPASLHAKTFIIDERISIIGSFNIDARSAFLSTESMVIIEGEAFAKQLRNEMELLLANSLIMTEDLTYIENEAVQEAKVSAAKKWTIKAVAQITRFFDYML